MPKLIISPSILAFLTITDTAYAHVGMEHFPWMHAVAHIVASAAIGMAIVAMGWYLLRKRSKLRWSRLQNK